jgi:hypothetical protein
MMIRLSAEPPVITLALVPVETKVSAPAPENVAVNVPSVLMAEATAAVSEASLMVTVSVLVAVL